jgi:hypothetical protein
MKGNCRYLCFKVYSSETEKQRENASKLECAIRYQEQNCISHESILPTRLAFSA